MVDVGFGGSPRSCLAATVYCSAVKLGGCHLGRWRMELLIINKHVRQSDAYKRAALLFSFW